ncbi:hypothetical protein QBC37DRAFT_479154 [Rhypophila decipiens]|uniref:Uncharacterized protein n=1 Tax=Rhypophila decipiens TaxID=261697 RepID=A0AAN6YGA7_9PEZI|nr:hypothetical protein QBC37DRAFT_479154 [Rhypophila decipiens]
MDMGTRQDETYRGVKHLVYLRKDKDRGRNVRQDLDGYRDRGYGLTSWLVADEGLLACLISSLFEHTVLHGAGSAVVLAHMTSLGPGACSLDLDRDLDLVGGCQLPSRVHTAPLEVGGRQHVEVGRHLGRDLNRFEFRQQNDYQISLTGGRIAGPCSAPAVDVLQRNKKAYGDLSRGLILRAVIPILRDPGRRYRAVLSVLRVFTSVMVGENVNLPTYYYTAR